MRYFVILRRLSAMPAEARADGTLTILPVDTNSYIPPQSGDLPITKKKRQATNPAIKARPDGPWRSRVEHA